MTELACCEPLCTSYYKYASVATLFPQLMVHGSVGSKPVFWFQNVWFAKGLFTVR